MIIQNGYASRNIPSADAYRDVYERRIAAKKSGDKKTANSLKLILNTCYGGTLNQYNDLYDPLMARSVCISGQLYLLELANHLVQDIAGLRVAALNTDGIMVEFDDSQYEAVKAIVNEWQQRTHFNLEEDVIERYYAKDCNSYVEVAADGSVKKKGGYLVRGVAPAGAFKVNNNATIVAKAIVEHFVHGTSPEDTINACDDPFQFQLIAKAGSKYREAYWMVNGEKRPVQKVNRVYAAKDPQYGKLYKVKTEDDSNAQIESLPEHCIIDNTAVTDPAHTTIDSIDKDWYIQLARKRIDDFYGIKPEKKERTKRMPKAASETPAPSMNVYQKLLAARVRFLDEAIMKNGKNMKLKYSFFELDDIVPMVTAIFNDLHLIAIVQFTDDTATMTIVDCDNPSDIIPFTSPMRPDTSGLITNEIQKLGSVQTYLRRYLYMTALDIVEADQIEERNGMTPPAAAAEQPKPPATPQERQEIKAKLANGADNADELQLEALKAVCRKMAAAGHTDEVVAIAQHTKNFTEISRADCEKLITGLNEALTKEGAANG